MGTIYELTQDPLWWGCRSVILLMSSQFNSMCGPAFDYTFQDYINEASQQEWDEWESEAARLELPLDYYIQEFVGQSA
jgi:hypothetical protein